MPLKIDRSRIEQVIVLTGLALLLLLPLFIPA